MKRFLPCLVIVLALLSLSGAAQAQFAHYALDHWYDEAVMSLQKAGILIGYPDGRFLGDRAITREEFAIAMKRALDSIATTRGTHVAASNDRPDQNISFCGDFFTGGRPHPSRFVLAGYRGALEGDRHPLFTRFLTFGDLNLDLQASLSDAQPLGN